MSYGLLKFLTSEVEEKIEAEVKKFQGPSFKNEWVMAFLNF